MCKHITSTVTMLYNYLARNTHQHAQYANITGTSKIRQTDLCSQLCMVYTVCTHAVKHEVTFNDYQKAEDSASQVLHQFPPHVTATVLLLSL